MKRIPLENLDLEVFYEKLNNGLEVFVVPKKGVSNIYATITTKYGSRHNTFVPINEDKMITVPDGVAHFLEHKLFEQEDGKDPFTFFSERGANANAYTSFDQTTYLFEGPHFFEENMNFLLDYVQSPYFTDDNVKKEKGIIISEIKMYEDRPYSVLYEKILSNNIIKDPMKIPIIGTIDSVNSITKEDLYKCYKTFYQPSNMFVVVTGNVDAKDVIDLIKNNQEKKSFEKPSLIKLKKYKEPKNVIEEKITLKMNVEIPKVALTFKIPLNKFKDLQNYESRSYISRFFDIKFGDTSEFNERMINSGIINYSLSTHRVDVNGDYTLITIDAETENPEKLVELIKDELKNREVSEEDFNRKNKKLLSSLLLYSESVESINRTIIKDIIRYGDIRYNYYNEVKEYSFDKFKFVVDNLNLDINSYIIVLPKD